MPHNSLLIKTDKITFNQALRRYLAFYVDGFINFLFSLITIGIVIPVVSIMTALLLFITTNVPLTVESLVYYISKIGTVLISSPFVGLAIILIFFIFIITLFLSNLLINSLVSATILYLFGTSLGKALLGLELMTIDNSPLTFKKLWKREFIKYTYVSLYILTTAILTFLGVFAIILVQKFFVHYHHINTLYIKFHFNFYVILITFTLINYRYLKIKDNLPYWDQNLNTIVRYKKLNWMSILAMIILVVLFTLPIMIPAKSYFYKLFNSLRRL